MKIKDFNWRKYLLDCLKSTDYCCIATIDNGSVWANPVYFAWDSKFNLYFISMSHVRHMQNISKNPKVAVAVYSTQQKGDVIGIQLEGKAYILKDQQEKKKAHKIYYRRVGSLEQNEPFIDNPSWLFVKIIPESIYYFNSKIFGEERQEVPKEKIK
ncbi:pyridoxamine 5'-phosphate oxidase family protein [Candidatus Daviesbacteria bacterium]|nr:pyridoxamine 5'-phosphate oxidase family protein [Candidatus Daviesbacteria bacterium]